jgi:predicted metal-dependent hydrolase
VSGQEVVTTDALQHQFSPAVLNGIAEDALAIWGAENDLPQFSIVWNKRLRTSGGRARLRERVVELNPRLLAQNVDQVQPVLIHEMAHLVTAARYGRVAAHGKEWRELMSQAGFEPRARHTMDVVDFYRPRLPRRHKASVTIIKRVFKRLIK